MRKFLSFLALLVVGFALPQWAHALDYSNDSNQPDYPDIYLRGENLGDVAWGYSDSYKFTQTNGHYSITVAKLDGQFKIAPTDWNDFNYGGNTSNDGDLKMTISEEPYTLKKGGKNLSADNLENVTISFDLSSPTDRPDDLKVTVEPAASMNPAKLYMYTVNVGDSNFPVTQVGEADRDNESYTFTRRFNKGEYVTFGKEAGIPHIGGFGGYRVGGNNDIHIPASDQAIITNSDASFVTDKKGKYTIKIDLKNNTVTTTCNEAWDFSAGTYPGKLRIYLKNVDEGWKDLTYNSGTGMWTTDDFVAKGSAGSNNYLNFDVAIYNAVSDESSSSYTYADKGRNSFDGEEWIEVDGTSGFPSEANKSFFQGGIIDGVSYHIDIKDIGDAAKTGFKFRVVKVDDPHPDQLYMYKCLRDENDGVELISAEGGARTNDTYTFTAELEANTIVTFFKTDKATTLGGYKDYRIYPSGEADVAIPATDIPIFTSGDNSFLTSKNGLYTITIDLKKATLTATCQSADDYPTLYLHDNTKPKDGGGTDWFNNRLSAKANNQGIYVFEDAFSANLYFILSNVESNLAWTDAGKEQLYRPGKDDGQDADAVDGAVINFDIHTNGGAFRIPSAGRYRLTVDMPNKKLTVEMIGVPDYVNMPLTSADFKGKKKHYFLVGTRMGEWKLQPEWEFKVKDDNTLELNNRYIYNGAFAIGVVDNFIDYVHHKYKIYANGTTFGGDNGVTYSDADQMVCNVTSDFSGNVTDSNLAKAECTAAPSNAFYARFDGKDKEKEGRGKFMKSIEIKLQDELPSTMTMTMGSADDAEANRLFALVGSKIYHNVYGNAGCTDNDKVGTKNQHLANAGKDGAYSGDGWQEGWIQFDDITHKPYVDAFGEYLYQTSFTPDWMTLHPSQFQFTMNDENRAFSSNTVMFVEASKLPNLDKDKYADYYRIFEGTEKIENGVTKTFGTNALTFNVVGANENPQQTAPWKCYVVRDMYISGEFKFWSGWGGNAHHTMGDELYHAYWHGPNGGPDTGDTTHPKESLTSSDVFSTGNVTIYRNGRDIGDGNYVIDKVNDKDVIKHFDRVILWFNNTDGVAKSYLQCITESLSPSIFGEAIPVKNESGEITHYNLKYNWFLGEAGNETDKGLQVESYRITLSRIVDNVMTPVGYPVGELKELTGITAGMIQEGSQQEFLSQTLTGLAEGQIFAPGVYQFEVTVNLKDSAGEKFVKSSTSTRVVISPTSTVASPDAVAMQLVELRSAYEDKYKENHASGRTYFNDDITIKYSDLTEADEKAGKDKLYLTYRPNDNANFFIMEAEERDAEGNVVSQPAEGGDTYIVPKNVQLVPSDKAVKFLRDNPDSYLWTSDYYVRCLDYNDYERTLSQYIDNGIITDKELPEPSLTIVGKVTNAEGTTMEHSHGKALRYTFSPEKDYYAAIIKRHGNLANATLEVKLEYSYTTAGNQTVDRASKALVQIDPVTPRPFRPRYRYVADRPEKTFTNEWGKITVPTHMWEHNNKQEAMDAGHTKDVYVHINDDMFNPRELKLQFEFMRPNVNDEILRNYDIHYFLTVTNSDDTVPLDVVMDLYDKEQSTERPNKYRLEINKLHPRNNCYPIVKFVRTEYQPNASAGAGNNLHTAYMTHEGNYGEFVNKAIECERSFVINSNNNMLEKVRLGYILDKATNKYKWMYKGHDHFSNSPDKFEATSAPYEDQNRDIETEAVYYLIELVADPGGAEATSAAGDTDAEVDNYYCYDYLVPHIDGHTNNPDRYLDKTTGLIINDSDPLIGTYITKGNFTTIKAPTVHATAIYIYERDVEHVGGAGDITEGEFTFNRLEVKDIQYRHKVNKEAAPASTRARITTPPTLSDMMNGKVGGLPDAGTVQADVLDMNKSDNGKNYVTIPGASINNAKDAGNDDLVTGVEDVLAGDDDAAVIYYNLQGCRIDNPSQSGVYFRVQGKNVTKVVVK